MYWWILQVQYWVPQDRWCNTSPPEPAYSVPQRSRQTCVKSLPLVSTAQGWVGAEVSLASPDTRPPIDFLGSRNTLHRVYPLGSRQAHSSIARGGARRTRLPCGTANPIPSLSGNFKKTVDLLLNKNFPPAGGKRRKHCVDRTSEEKKKQKKHGGSYL